ncbi:helix-turn-helix domain-containing protein [Fibrella arboris]|uniref:helix-turn-helix domain-containing protein n=1 Tax=Fibrella arboris TaxID=3242486 RepID=UPI0035209B86
MRLLPPHLDLFGLIILLGVAQGLFLGFFFLTGSRQTNVANRCLGWLMIGVSAIIGEIFLCYSNYMFQALAWVDFSEPLNFGMGPLFFLYVFARIHGRLPRHWYWHLLPMLLWSVDAVSWLVQPIDYKYNNYLEAWHPELPSIPDPPYYLHEDFFGIREYIDELTLISCLTYNVLAFLIIRRALQQAGRSVWAASPAIFARLRNLTLLFSVLPVLIVIVKPQFHEDLGDYLLACYLTGVIYVTSFLVMRGSDFFRDNVPDPADSPTSNVPDEPRKKYEKSSLSEEVEDAVLRKLEHLLITEKPYLQTDMSLPKLATRLNTSPHHLSQLLNDRLGQRFFDWLATYRIAEAQRLLHSPDTAYLKIDEIAERVGYNSPSAFHTAFKRITNQTPAQFRDAAQIERQQGR